MLTGSFASSFHGEPRATRDMDLVIEADANRLPRSSGRSRQTNSMSTKTLRWRHSRRRPNSTSSTSPADGRST